MSAFDDFCPRALPVALAALLQTTLLLSAGLLLGVLLRRRGPAVAALIQRATLAALVVSLAASLGGASRLPTLWRVSLPSASRAAPALRTAPPVSLPVLPSQPVLSPAPEQNVASPAEDAVPSPPKMASAPRPTGGALRWQTVALGIWAGGAGAGLLWLAASHWLLRRLRRGSHAVTDPRAADALRDLSNALGVRPPQLRAHPSVHSPFLAGARRAVIFLPATWAEDFDALALRAVLAHELAHFARRDPAWNLLARLLGALLWPQPLLVPLRRQRERTAEEVCDLTVLHLSACPPRAYADCLLRLAERGHVPRLAVGIVPFRSALARRVALILSKENSAMKPLSPRARLCAAFGAACLVAVSLCAVSITNAQSPAPDADAVQKQNVAISNAKHFGLAMQQYVQDYDGTFPPATRWMDVVKPYFRNDESVFQDPAAPNQKYAFAFNRALSGKKVTRLRNASEVAAFFSSTTDRRNASDNGESLPRPGRHSGGSIYGFADGHIRWYPDSARPSLTPVFSPLPKPRALTPAEIKARFVAQVYAYNQQWVEKYNRLARAQTELDRARAAYRVASAPSADARLRQLQAELARTKAELALAKAELALRPAPGVLNRKNNGVGQPEQMERTRVTTGFLDKEIEVYKAKMRQAENALTAYKQHHNGQLPEAQSNDIAQFSNLKAQLESMKITADDAALRQAALMQRMAQLNPNLTEETAGVSPFDHQINDLKARKEALIASGKSAGHPMVRALADQIAAMQHLRAHRGKRRTVAVNPEYQNLQEQLTRGKIAQMTQRRQMQALQAQVADYEARVRRAPQGNQRLKQLQRDYWLNKAQYQKMLAWQEAYRRKLKLEEAARKAGTPK